MIFQSLLNNDQAFFFSAHVTEHKIKGACNVAKVNNFPFFFTQDAKLITWFVKIPYFTSLCHLTNPLKKKIDWTRKKDLKIGN